MPKQKCKFGEILLAQLESVNKTQKWLADKCGVTKGQISHIISGKSKPSFKLLTAISQALNLEPISMNSCSPTYFPDT